MSEFRIPLRLQVVGALSRFLAYWRTLALLCAGSILSGCVTGALDLDDRGNKPVSRGLLAEMRKKGMTPRSPVLIRIFKQESELEVWKQDRSGRYALLTTYPMCRWSGRLGPKKAEGDRQAPEGFYKVTKGRLNPRSRYHLSFDLGYPNALERAKGYTGSALMVHGACSSSGCFAISDDAVADAYAVVRDALKAGQSSVQVQSLPFRMTPRNMAIHRDNPSYEFWTDLKKGADRFDVTRKPSEFVICEGRYRFGLEKPANRRSNPLGACPSNAPILPAVERKWAADISEMNALLEAGVPTALTYRDGGMHTSFRKLLRTQGAKRLAEKTSSTEVPISRPKAALADPYPRTKSVKATEKVAR